MSISGSYSGSRDQFKFNMGFMGFSSTDFFSATYSPIDFKIYMQLPYGEVSKS
jgi:hypothetical protein